MMALTMAASSAIGGQVADEALVDLQLVHREALEVAQAGIAGAEIVDRQAHAHRRDLLQPGAWVSSMSCIRVPR
jgi:hypothetical protein